MHPAHCTEPIPQQNLFKTRESQYRKLIDFPFWPNKFQCQTVICVSYYSYFFTEGFSVGRFVSCSHVRYSTCWLQYYEYYAEIFASGQNTENWSTTGQLFYYLLSKVQLTMDSMRNFIFAFFVSLCPSLTHEAVPLSIFISIHSFRHELHSNEQVDHLEHRVYQKWIIRWNVHTCFPTIARWWPVKIVEIDFSTLP